MRRWCYVLVVLFALLTAFGGRAVAQSPGESGCGRLILRTNAAGSFDTLCLGDAGASYAISPDGQLAATARVVGGSAAISIADIAASGGNASGSPAVVPLGSDSLFADHLTFSPDSAQLAFAIEGSSGTQIGVETLGDPEAAQTVLPLPALESADGAPTNVVELLWSPDGAALTAVLANYSLRNPGFAIVALDPTGAQPPRFLLPYGPLCIYGLAWSPDGSTLAFAAAGLQNPCGDRARDGVYTLDAASGAVTRLTGAIALSRLSWTADGRVLALVAPRDVPEAQQVALFGLDGRATYINDPRPSACASLGGASSPQEANGLLLYQAVDGSIVVDNLGAGTQLLLMEAGPSSLHSPLLSPDGSNVAYTEQVGVGTDGYQTVVRIDAVGGATAAQTTIAGTTLTLDSWLPDGTGLVAQAETGEHELCPAGG
jgi:Tol biopolymer transport system component